MGALKGNKNGRGNHNSGRKSAYQERADALTLERMYFDTQEAEEVRRRIESGGEFSIKDRHVLNALEGDQKAITPIFNKVFPDRIEHSGEVVSKVVRLDE
jgi:hypothetical protein